MGRAMAYLCPRRQTEAYQGAAHMIDPYQLHAMLNTDRGGLQFTFAFALAFSAETET